MSPIHENILYAKKKRRMNSRTSMAQREDAIWRNAYVSDIDHQVELRFAFIEFTDEEGVKNALSLAGTMLGYYAMRVLPFKTAIAPVNHTFLPRASHWRKKKLKPSLSAAAIQ